MDDRKQETAAPTSNGPIVVSVDAHTLLRHIERLLPLVLDIEPSDTVNTLTSKEGVAHAARFCIDAQVPVLYIIKEREEQAGKDEGMTENVGQRTRPSKVISAIGETFNLKSRISVHLELSYNATQSASLAIIKRFPTVEAVRPLQQQLQLINLPDPGETGNPYEALHSYIHHAVAPFFDAYAATKLSSSTSVDRLGRDEKDSKTGSLAWRLLCTSVRIVVLIDFP